MPVFLRIGPLGREHRLEQIDLFLTVQHVVFEKPIQVPLQKNLAQIQNMIRHLAKIDKSRK